MGSTPPPHDWYVSRLEALAVGLLPPAERQKVREHVLECPDCRERMAEPLQPQGGVRGEHVPASLIARWPAVGQSISQLERDLVEHHLARCESCREELRLVTSLRPLIPVRDRRATVWKRGLLTGSLAAAALAVFAVGIQDPGAPAGTRGAPAVHLASAGVRLRDVLRGPPSAAPTRVTVRGAEAVVLALEPFDAPDDTVVLLELLDRDGRRLQALHRRQSELYPDRSLILGSESNPLPAGEYRLRMTARLADAFEQSQTFAFLVVRLAP